MILYFSGTGNSEYIAKKIRKEISDEAVNLFEKIRNMDFTPMHSSTPWIIVSPTYAWRIPKVVENWLKKTELTGNKTIYFVMTCGGSIGNAGNYLEALSRFKNLSYMGCMSIKMPENYIAMFTTPDSKQALSIIQDAESILKDTVNVIKSNIMFDQPPITYKDKRNSGIINRAFYSVFVQAKKFYATDKCVSCAKCSDVCPLSNIELKNGKPIWGKNCTHCMACISYCPTEAIEYGNHTKGLNRYTCPIVIK